MTMSLPVLVIVAWGALAFGAPYDWAYWPLLAGCALVGAWGLVRRVPPVRKRSGAALLTGLLFVGAAIGAQLVPLDRNTIIQISPATDSFLRQYDVAYALRVVLETRREADAPSPEPQAPISHPLSINPDKTLLGLAFLGGFGLFLMGLQRGLDGRDLRVVAPGLAGLGVVMALVAIVQKALWNGKVYGLWVPENKDFGAFGPFINRNHFAGWMLLALPVVIAYFAALVSRGMVGVSPGWRNRVAWFSTPDASRAVLTGFSILVMGFALTLSLSRSGISCFLLAILMSSFFVLRRQSGTAKGRMLAAYLVAVFVAAISWTGIDAIAQRFEKVDWELGGRAGAWEDAWRIHGDFPIFGSGFNTYGTATTLLQHFEVKNAHFAEAHNDYLQVLTEGGYLVAAPILVLTAIFAWLVLKRFREANDDGTGYWLRLGAVTGIVAMALQEVVEFSLQMPGNAALFTVLCAIAVRRASPKRTPSRRDDTDGTRLRASLHTPRLW